MKTNINMDTKQILESVELKAAINNFCFVNGIDRDTDEGNNQIDCFILGYIAAATYYETRRE